MGENSIWGWQNIEFINNKEIRFERTIRVLKPSDIKKVIFNPPATILLTTNGQKIVVKCREDDTYNPELGLAMCIAEYACGGKENMHRIFKDWVYGK